MPLLKDLKQDLARTLSYLDQLDVQVEERQRLVELGLEPLAADNLELVSCVEKCQKLLNYLQDDVTEFLTAHPDQSVSEDVVAAVNRYNAQLDLIEGSFIASNYRVDLRPLKKTEKSVRFTDDPDANQWLDLMGTSSFRPYTDDPEESDAATLGLVSQSNHEIFALHQQQLLEQDESLDRLHDSIRIQHTMGNQINDELDDHLILLRDLEEGVDGSQRRLDHAQRRLRHFSTRVRENGSLVTIIVLTVILILLLVVLN